MKRVIKGNKRGMTFVEVILVVAIIVILATVFTLNINDIMTKSKNASSRQAASRKSVSSGIAAHEAELRDDYNF